MKPADGVVIFKEWLPDLPDLDNPGLIEAKNTVPADGNYHSFYDINDGGNTLPSLARGAYRAFSTAGAEFLVGTGTQLYKNQGGAWTALSATFGAATYWRFAQFDDLVICASDASVPLARTIGSASNFANLATAGSAPVAQQVAKIGQFIVVGDRNNAEPHAVQWPVINDPRNWPTPGSDTAIAGQAGEQLLRSEFGTVNGITSGDQFGLILQAQGITRMTYVGGTTVFQFDEISEGIGMFFPNSLVSVQGVDYFATLTGFYRTNGTTVESISAGKTSRYFLSSVDYVFAERVYAGVDYINKCIYWSYPTAADSGVPTRVLIYNWIENRWARAETTLNSIAHSHIINASTFGMEAFSLAGRVGQIGNTALPNGGGIALSAILTTGETEFQRGGYTLVQGVKGLVRGTSNYTIAIGTRNDYATASPSFTAETTANSRTGFSDFRSEARYHRARLTIAGTFNSAQGIEFQFAGSGAT